MSLSFVQDFRTASLEQLLVSGSDTRATVDERTGLNRFGCAPTPRATALSFGSCTASSISEQAFRCVADERERLLSQFPADATLDAPMEALRREMRELLGLAQTSAEIVLSPSGTDSVLHALFLTRALNGGKPLDCLLVASEETGSGVSHALMGRHFGTITAEGIPVTQGGPIAGLSDHVSLIPLRMRAPERADEEVFDAVSRSVSAGHHVLLQVMDSSKLGTRLPSMACLDRIQSHFSASVTIVVDACQMRLGLDLLNRHVAQGRMVLISGSKFFTGPPFSGALLVPAPLCHAVGAIREVPPGLRDYTNRSAWPASWGCLRAALPEKTNYGQYFRWAAALDEMRRYFAVPMEFRRTVLRRFGALTLSLLRRHSPDLLLLDTCPCPQEEDASEMGIRTIFPFLVRRGKRWMSFAEATHLYHALNQNLVHSLPDTFDLREKALAARPCHLGQPVNVTLKDGQKAGALRLCAGARTVTQLWAKHRADASALQLEQEHRNIETVLDKITLIAYSFPSSEF